MPVLPVSQSASRLRRLRLVAHLHRRERGIDPLLELFRILDLAHGLNLSCFWVAPAPRENCSLFTVTCSLNRGAHRSGTSPESRAPHTIQTEGFSRFVPSPTQNPRRGTSSASLCLLGVEEK